MSENTFAAQIPIKLPEVFLKDLVIDASLYIDYWGRFAGSPELALTEAGVFIEELDVDGDGHVVARHLLNRSALINGLKKLGSVAKGRFLTEIISENYDAESADVLIQLAVLGEVRYA